jgi:NAD(P)-dependent dehydrogenase (short-subunit alcohol dehydrogenase family)
MNILITGDKGLAEALQTVLMSEGQTVTCVSRQSAHDIKNVKEWGPQYWHYDVCINCAYDSWHQIDVLEQFYYAWRDIPHKQIINIGSKIADYARIEAEIDYQYMEYRVHKQALELAFNRMVNTAACDIKLINPGAIDTDMISHLSCKKMDPAWLAQQIVELMKQPAVKRVDIWQ